MIVDIWFLALAAPAVLFAGISKGGFGAGAAFAATPFLALILEPGQSIGLMLPLLMVMDLGALRAYWGKWDKRAALRLIAGSVPGIALGTALYRIAPDDLFRVLIGCVALGFVAFQLGRQRGWLRLGRARAGAGAGYFWGGVAGFTSFISHAGGPPAAVYLLGRGYDKTTYQATSVLAFWAINLLKVPSYIAMGIFSRDTLIADLYLVPVALLGVFFGVKLHNMISDKSFFRLVFLFLVLTGVKLIWDGLT